MNYYRLIDANLARASEGLRVLEDVGRFELNHSEWVHQCKGFRNRLQAIYSQFSHHTLVNARETGTDVRAKSNIPKRPDLHALLIANIKRVTEALRCLEETTHMQDCTHLRYDLYAFESTICHAIRRHALTGPGIYVVSDDADHLMAVCTRSFVPVVQFRSKTESKADIYAICKKLAPQIQKTNTLFMVNDHADIALAVNADGVHVGQDDMPTPAIRSLLGPTPIIGRTTHSFEQGLAAKKEGADYVSCGPIWDTPSKPNRAGIGFDYLKESHQLGLPVVAIGGIDLTNIEQILKYNPAFIGAIRATTAIDALWKKIKKTKKGVDTEPNQCKIGKVPNK